MLNIYFAAGSHNWPDYALPLEDAFRAQGLDVRLSATPPADPAKVDYIIYAPGGDIDDFAPYTRAKLVQSLWAGVERIVGNESLTQPLARMVDQGLSEGMVEWVAGHVLRHHLGMDRHIVNPAHRWDHNPPPLARDRHIGILGMGALGAASARALKALNFRVTGWSRTEKRLEGLTCLHGAEGLDQILHQADMLVLLLPKTPETENILNARAFALMKKGMVLLNPGRGALIDDAALLSALADGTVAHATLDVFRVEPLPADHPFWAHPRVTVTPHIAADTRAPSAARIVAENIARVESGEAPLHLVDRTRGY
jgi:glyoxylate/hydroxypyruvate reductase A